MKYDCCIIKDLLPLYADNAISEKSHEIIEEHLHSCESCSEFLGTIKKSKRSRPKKELPRESQAMRNIAKMMRRRLLKRISMIVGVFLLAIFLFLVLGLTRFTTWRSDMKVIDFDKAYKSCPVILITDSEREFVAAALEYCEGLSAADPDDKYIYPESHELQPLLDTAGVRGIATRGLYIPESGLLSLSYDDIYYRYELSIGDKEAAITKIVSEPSGADIGILQRDYSYLNTDNEYFERHTRHIDLWATIKANLKLDR